MVQILDQTAARLRVSLHGRTLVEMAIVRICQLDDLDDLASLVAETARRQREVSRRRRAAAAKKNVEPPTGSALAQARFRHCRSHTRGRCATARSRRRSSRPCRAPNAA